MPDSIDPLKNMTRASVTERNTLLWAYLATHGHYVEAVRPSEDSEEIDCLIVSVAPPTLPIRVLHPSTTGGVGLPVEGAEVGQVVGPAAGVRDNVINLPTRS